MKPSLYITPLFLKWRDPKEWGFIYFKPISKKRFAMKRILLITFILSMFLLLFMGCDQSCIINSDVVLEDGIEYYLQTDAYTLGSSVKILYRLNNKSDTVRLPQVKMV